jgi:hypothetical protein
LKGAAVLFFVEGEFVDVVREDCYSGVLTFCGSNPQVLESLVKQTGTMAEPVQLHNQAHKWALHVPDDRSVELLAGAKWSEIETVARLTEPALAYAYDFVLSSSVEAHEQNGGTLWGDYGYCWPEEIAQTREDLYNREDPVHGDVAFVPIWSLPNELTGAPRTPIVIDSDDDTDLQ